MRPLITMRQAIFDRGLLGSAFPRKAGEPDTWVPWKAMALAAMGEALRPRELAAFQKMTKRETAPTERVEELVVIKGRRSGGTTYSAVIVTYLAGLVDYSDTLGVGERGVALLMAPTQRQAEIAFQRVEGLFDASPLLRSMIIGRTASSLSLNNGVDVEVQSASPRSLRGLTLVGAVADEAAFFQTESTSRNSDVEILNAVRPALMTTRGLLVIASSPYAAQGELYDAYTKFYGKDGPILVAKAASRETNPTLSEAFIARQMERDPVAARSEFFGEFRTDVTGFIDRDKLTEAVDQGVLERPPVGGHVAFADAAAGLEESADGDSYTLSIGHATDDGTVIIDLAREWKPPFSAADVTATVAGLLKEYGCETVTTDGYSAGFVRSELARHGIGHAVSEFDKSALYAATLPMLTSRRVRLPDSKTLVDQFCSLERRPGANGRDRIDSRGHEDLANSCAGVIALLSAAKPIAGWGVLEWMRRKSEASASEAPPTLQQEHGDAAVLQIGRRRPSHFVRVIVPGEPSHLYTPSGVACQVEIENGQRVAYVSPDDARELVGSALNVAFFEMNAELRAGLGAEPARPRGIRMTDWLQAAEDARPRRWDDRGGMAMDALRAAGRWPQ